MRQIFGKYSIFGRQNICSTEISVDRTPKSKYSVNRTYSVDRKFVHSVEPITKIRIPNPYIYANTRYLWAKCTQVSYPNVPLSSPNLLLSNSNLTLWNQMHPVEKHKCTSEWQIGRLQVCQLWLTYGGYTADIRRTYGWHTADIRLTYARYTAEDWNLGHHTKKTAIISS